MDTVPGQIYVAFGAVLAALIAGAFSYFNLISAKESKVSEFRQAWIDALRSEITTYISRVAAVNTLGAYIHENLDLEHKYNIELIQERSRLYEEALAAYHAIHLRVNKQETNDDARVLNDGFLHALENAHVWYKMGLSEVLEDNLTSLSEAAAPLLKHEWKRVKRGEPNYRYSKWGAFGIACASLILLAVVYYGQKSGASASAKLAPAPATAVSAPSPPAPPVPAKTSPPAKVSPARDKASTTP